MSEVKTQEGAAMSDPIYRELQGALDPEHEARAILAQKAPLDALDIFQHMKFSVTKMFDALALQESRKFPGRFMARQQITMSEDFNYDGVVAVLEEMVRQGKLGKRKNARGDYEYYLS